MSPSTILFYILWLSTAVRAYIPAIATNDTQSAIQSGLNVTDVSTLNLLWYENGCALSPFCNSSPVVVISNLETHFGYTEGSVRMPSMSPTSWWGLGAVVSIVCVVYTHVVDPLTDTDP